MGLTERIGVDLGRKLPVEDGIAWAAANGVSYIDAELDLTPNALEPFDEARCRRVREACAGAGIHLGLHTLSAVNVAEVSPFLRDAADDYLRAYIDAAKRLEAEWIVVHAGYHFTADRRPRMEAALERLKRAADYAERRGALLRLENLNWEPERAEVHYLAHNVEEAVYFLARIDSPALGWSFTVNHATLVPEGIDGTLDAMPLARCGEVRLADNNGEYEVHLKPGEGIIDFGALFRRLEGEGFRGHYMCAFGSPDDMLAGRAYMVEAARRAGVPVE